MAKIVSTTDLIIQATAELALKLANNLIRKADYPDEIEEKAQKLRDLLRNWKPRERTWRDHPSELFQDDDIKRGE